MDFYKSLRECFPNHSRDKIETTIDYVNQDGGGEDPDDFKFNRMVTILLDEPSTGDTYHDCSSGSDDLYDEAVGFNRRVEAQSIKKQNIDNIYTRLTDMLPKVDPSFLKKEAENLLNKDEAFISSYVNNMLDQTDYPTIEEFYKREAEKMAVSKYTDKFLIDQFLKEFPDPLMYFQKEGRPHSLLPKNPPDEDLPKQIKYSIAVLQNHYNKLKNTDIEAYMKYFKNDIVKTCIKLDKFPKSFKTQRQPKPLPPCSLNNKLMYQELAFVIHKHALQRYLKLKNESYARSVEEARRANLLQTCQCCYYEELIPEECYFCLGDCIFCKDCVRTGAETKIGEGKVDFECFNQCGQMISMRTLKMVLDPITYYRLDERKQIDEVRKANIKGFETCPHCDYGTITGPDDKIFYCRNPECGKETCRECQHPAHVPQRCNEIEYDEDVKLRTYIENKMTEALVRTCAKCNNKIVKDSGCNKMTCTCGTPMCYICGETNINYHHFGAGKCQLHSDEAELHNMNIVNGAKQAKKDLGVDKNPKILKFDPTRGLDNYQEN